MQSLRGQLLIATPVLQDPNFQRTVVLIAEHNSEGAMGIVLNRPSEAPVSDATPELEPFVDYGAAVHEGGPVQPTAVVVLAEFVQPEPETVLLIDTVGFLPAGVDLDDLLGNTVRARVFAGYAGWGPGQLEQEIDREDWILGEPLAHEVFTDNPEDLWSESLERKGGAYALLARMPDDPSLN
ncbi:MAG: YqgE/AlgH family protein [Solirubrobacterales bacterium]|nr:YqgE/AlgH family protein [Solirubrobacterales bacterium]